MSSIFGHALIGAALGDNVKAKSKAEKIFICLFFVVLSICPDLDYLPTWFLGLEMEPRYSHSIAGLIAIGIIGLAFKKYIFSNQLRNASLVLIFAAPASHVMMDFFVGVHRNPVLWPINSGLYAFEHGILPSAGKLDIGNYYFWRNLAIEFGILIPVAIFVSATGRRLTRHRKLIAFIAIALFLFFGYVGFGLQR